MDVCSTAQYLKNYGEGMLTRLHFARQLLHPSNRSVFLSVDGTRSEFAKVVKECSKAFPSEPKDIERQPGYDAFKAKDSAIRSELQPIFEALLAALDFAEGLHKLLAKLVASQAKLKLNTNPLLTVAVMDCVCICVKSRKLVRTLLDWDVVMAVTVYNLCTRIMEHNSHFEFNNVCQFLVEVEKKIGIKSLQAAFEPSSALIGEAVMDAFMRLMGTLNTTLFAKQGLLNPLHSPELMLFPLPTETYYDNMVKAQLEDWVCCGFLVCPEELAREGGLDALKLALSQQFATEVTRDVCLDMHEIFEFVFDKYDRKGALKLNKKKNKAYLEEAALAAVSSNLSQRLERRTYVGHEITNMVNIFKDSPGLLGPKSELAVCCLAMVRQEVMWYFRHLRTPAPTVHKVNKKYNANLLNDPALPALIHQAVSLIEILGKHREIIQDYHVDLLKGLDLSMLVETCRSLSLSAADPTYVPDSVMALLEDLKAKVAAISFTKGKPPPDLEPIRKLVYRLQGEMSSTNASKPLVGALEKLCYPLLTIETHTRMVDDWDHVMRTHMSLGTVFFFQSLHLDMLKTAMRGVDDTPASCLSLVKVVGQAMYHVHPHCPLEHPNLGTQCTAVASKFMDEVKRMVDEAFTEIFNQFYKLDVAEVQPSRSVGSHMQRGMMNALPGTESYGSRRLSNPIWGWAHKQNYLMRIVSECDQNKSIDVHATRFHPKEYVRQVVHERVRLFLRQRVPKQATITSPPILRPTEFLAQLNNLVRVCNTVCSYISLDFECVLRDELLCEVWDPTVGVFGMRSGKPGDAHAPLEKSRPLVQLLAEWMLFFVESQMGSTISHFVDSPWRGTVVTMHADPQAFRAEQYLDNKELTALVTVVGAYGVLHIDRKLLQAVAKNMGEMKKELMACARNLQALKAVWSDPKKVQLLKETMKIKELDGFMRRMVNVGKLLVFRERLFEKLNIVLAERAPAIVNTAKVMQEAYYESASRDPAVRPGEFLARSVGLSAPNSADALLMQALAPFMDDQSMQLWQTMPTALAASFTSSFWKYREPKYNVATGAYSNNAGCIITTFVALTAAFAGRPSSLVSANPTGAPDAERHALEEFVRMGGYVVMKMRLAPELAKDYNTDDMVIFLDKVIAGSRPLRSVPLDAYLPNSLVESVYLNYNPVNLMGGGDDLAVERGSRVTPV